MPLKKTDVGKCVGMNTKTHKTKTLFKFTRNERRVLDWMLRCRQPIGQNAA
jgi:hypothetical protein